MPQAALGNIGHSVSPHEGLGAKSRRRRYILRAAAQRILHDEAITKCGAYAHSGLVAIRADGDRAAFGNLAQCKRIWDCPHCAALISAKRRDEVRELIEAHARAGGSVWMGALTVPHARFDEPRQLRRAVADCWRRVQSGAPWLRAIARAGFIGSVRALEVTHGRNGWHPHLHVLFFFRAAVPDSILWEFGDWMAERWSRIVKRRGLGQCNPAVAVTFERAQSTERAGLYVTKWGSEFELLGGQGKAAKNGNRSPWQLLDDYAAGDRHSGMLFRVYALAFKGARQLTYSKGLRDVYELREPGADEDLDLQELAEHELGVITNEVYWTLARRRLLVDLLEAVEASPSWQTVVVYCFANDVPLDGRCRARPAAGYGVAI